MATASFSASGAYAAMDVHMDAENIAPSFLAASKVRRGAGPGRWTQQCPAAAEPRP